MIKKYWLPMVICAMVVLVTLFDIQVSGAGIQVSTLFGFGYWIEF